MSGGSIRAILATIVGIFSAIFLFTIVTKIADKLGLPVFIDFGETITVRRGVYDEEINSATTALGYWAIIISIVFGWWVWMVVNTKKLNVSLTKDRYFSLSVFVVCVTLYAFTITLVWQFFGRELMKLPAAVSNLLDVGLLVGLGYVGVRYWRKRSK